jgi:putative antirepressor
MNELIKIEINENNEQVVSGRELHKFLEITERYSRWFERMCEYGFVENIDYVGCKVFNALAKQELQDHLIKIPMAKEISMIQRNEKGKAARLYFIKCEEAWNTPEMILLKADQIKNKMIDGLKLELDNIRLELDYNKEIIKGITENIDLYQKRIILGRVVKHKGANFRERWNELYKCFRETHHIDLKARMQGYNETQIRPKDKCKSTIEYADKFGHIDNLYKVALKLYETDVEEIIENIKNIT